MNAPKPQATATGCSHHASLRCVTPNPLCTASVELAIPCFLAFPNSSVTIKTRASPKVTAQHDTLHRARGRSCGGSSDGSGHLEYQSCRRGYGTSQQEQQNELV